MVHPNKACARGVSSSPASPARRHRRQWRGGSKRSSHLSRWPSRSSWKNICSGWCAATRPQDGLSVRGNAQAVVDISVVINERVLCFVCVLWWK